MRWSTSTTVPAGGRRPISPGVSQRYIDRGGRGSCSALPELSGTCLRGWQGSQLCAGTDTAQHAAGRGFVARWDGGCVRTCSWSAALHFPGPPHQMMAVTPPWSRRAAARRRALRPLRALVAPSMRRAGALDLTLASRRSLPRLRPAGSLSRPTWRPALPVVGPSAAPSTRLIDRCVVWPGAINLRENGTHLHGDQGRRTDNKVLVRWPAGRTRRRCRCHGFGGWSRYAHPAATSRSERQHTPWRAPRRVAGRGVQRDEVDVGPQDRASPRGRRRRCRGRSRRR